MNLAKLFAEWKAKVIAQRAWVEATKIKSKIDKIEKTNLWTITWVGDTTIKKLLENWIGNIEELKEVWIRKLKELELNPFSFKAIEKFLKDNK